MTTNIRGHKQRFGALIITCFLLLSASGLACNAAAPVDSSTSEPLAQTQRDKQIANYFTRLLEIRHISRHKIDETTSKRSFELFLKAIDPAKLYFNQQDVDEFTAAYGDTMAAQAKSGNLSPAFVMYNRYLQRVDERCAIAQKLLEENNFDFTVDEEFLRDKDAAVYPRSQEEVLDRMRKRVKFEILSLEAENRDKKKDADANANAENKSETETEPNAEATDPLARPEDPISKLKRRYSTLQKRLHQTENDDLLEIYLTAIGNAFDPHTTYMSPKSYENFMIQIGLNLEGIGATLQWDDGYTIVKRIVKGSPAEKQGELKVEDKIVGVGQGEEGPIEDVVDMKLTDVVEKIRGKGGTIVRLEVVSQDGKKKIIKIRREKVDLEDSAAQEAISAITTQDDGSYEIVDATETEAPAGSFKVGVIDLPSFYLDMKSSLGGEGRSVSADVRRILLDFNRKEVDACVVDLRYNGGGSLPEAVKLTGLFIEKGAVVQTLQPDVGDHARSLDDPDPRIIWSKPLVVMTSRLSASASEIFAGAIKDYRRGLIVGDETTHGKGSVQSMMELADVIFNAIPMLRRNTSNLGAAKLTIQGFYLPSGNSPQLQGVRSDVVLPQFTSALEDIAESDLDYPLSFAKISPSVYPVFDYVTAPIVDAVNAKSQARVANSKEFQEELDKINVYKEMRARKATPLKREKYFEELDKLNANKEETDRMEEIVNGDAGVKRDYYLDEVIYLSKDYVDAIKTSQAL